jgi:peptidoglycan/LPS O-acetylase OafA/YrhL
MTATPMTTTAPRANLGSRTSTYGRHMSGVLVAAFTLSVVHTIYAWVAGIEDPTFTVDTPLAWGFYAVAFGMATLARRNERWAQLAVLAYLATVLGIAFFYYPTVFGAEQQTVFGWFENDVYVGLLVTATYLGVLRLRRTTLTPV